MDDTASSTGLSAYAGRQIQAEFVDSGSVLVNKQIDTIKVTIRKGGTPTGNAIIGVFYGNLTVKKQFGTIDVSTLDPSTYAPFTFTSGTAYTIAVNDRIGVKYTGGDSINFIAVMRDTTGGFDSTNSYH